MNPIERAVRSADRFQQQHPVLGIPVAVVKKFGDDKGGPLTMQLTYSAFFALFPLLLLLVTLLGYLLEHNPALEKRILHSVLAEFPILGPQLENNVHSLRASGVGLLIGVAGSLWGARGLTQSGQHAMAEIWNIKGSMRPSFWVRQLRGLALLLVFAVGLVSTTALTTLGSLNNGTRLFHVGFVATSALMNIGLFLLAYRVLTPPPIRTRQLLPGAVLAGVAWQALLAAGSYLIGHYLRHAGEVYGFFAIVLGLLTWLYLGAQVILIAAEVNVVLIRKLWPRGIVQPPLTSKDKEVLVDLAKQEERRPEQTVEVSFSPEAGQPPEPS